MSLDTIFEQYQLGNATLASERGIVAAKQAIEAYVAEKAKEAYKEGYEDGVSR